MPFLFATFSLFSWQFYLLFTYSSLNIRPFAPILTNFDHFENAILRKFFNILRQTLDNQKLPPYN
jgi:hypothetical protein